MWPFGLPPTSPPPPQAQMLIGGDSTNLFLELANAMSRPSTSTQILIPIIVAGPIAILSICGAWLVAGVVAFLDDMFKFLNGHFRQSSRNLLCFATNLIHVMMFDAAGCLFVLTLSTLLAFVFRMLKMHIRALAKKQVDGAHNANAEGFDTFLCALELSVDLFLFRMIAQKFGAPFQTTLGIIVDYLKYLTGNQLAAPPQPPLVNGRLLGAHQVVQVVAQPPMRRGRAQAR